MLSFRPQDEVHPVGDDVWREVVKASVVATQAFLLAIDATGAAVHVQLYHVFRALVPAQEARVGMGGSPYAHHGRVYQRGQVHVGTVHAHHHVELTHQDQLFLHVSQLGRGVYALCELFLPLVHDIVLIGSATKEENTATGIL